MAGKDRASKRPTRKALARVAYEDIPNAKELKARFDRIFPELPRAFQDVYVRLVEASLRSLRR